MRKWYFSKEKYLAKNSHCLDDTQAVMLDGEEVGFATPENRLGRTKILGFIVDREWCEKREEKPFKVGDRARIRAWDDMAREYETCEDSIKLPHWGFVNDMKILCGNEFTITGFNGDLVEGLDTDYVISADMLEHVEEPEKPIEGTSDTAVMFVKLTKNPDRKYKRTDDGLVIEIKDGKYHWESGHRALSPDDRWVEVAKEKEVSFIEAVKAFSEKKTIVCQSGLGKTVYKYDGYSNSQLTDQSSRAISHIEILNGHWFIREV